MFTEMMSSSVGLSGNTNLSLLTSGGGNEAQQTQNKAWTGYDVDIKYINNIFQG